MLIKISQIFSKMKTHHLVLLPIVIGASILLIALTVGKLSPMGNHIARLLIPLGFFAWGFMGIPMIIRKEVPWLITIKGWLAIVQGALLMAGSWVIAVILLIVLLRN